MMEDAVHVTGQIDGRVIELHHGRAHWEKEYLEVEFSGEPLTCGAPLQKASAPRMHFQIPPGPGGRFYMGGVVGLGMHIEPFDEKSLEFPPRAMLVELSKVEPRSGGAVTGSLVIQGKQDFGKARADITGEFSVHVCGPGPQAQPAGIPEQAPPDMAPIRSGLALFQKADSDLTDEIWLFSSAVGCRTPGLPHTFSFDGLANFGALRVGKLEARGPQPAELRFHPPVSKDTMTGGSAFPEGEAAIVWEAQPRAPGAKVRGRVMTPKGPYGEFVAVVCK